MVYKKKFKKMRLWSSVNTGQFGLGINFTKWVPCTSIDCKLSVKISFLFMLLILDFEK